MSDTLAPCPFCGMPARLVHSDGMWWCECINERNCSTVQPVCNHADVAIKTWNRRTAPAKPDAQVDMWTPVEDDFQAGTLTTWNDDKGEADDKHDWWIAMGHIAMALPPDVRLCRNRPAAEAGA